MSENPNPLEAPGGQNREELHAALFADLVTRQVNMAAMFLGQAPLPGSDKPAVDLEAAQMFIEQLEMIEVKTRGNLTKAEAHLLRQSLSQLQMLFVKVCEQGETPQKGGSAGPGTAPAAPVADPDTPQPPAADTLPGEGEPKPKFTKKY